MPAAVKESGIAMGRHHNVRILKRMVILKTGKKDQLIERLVGVKRIRRVGSRWLQHGCLMTTLPPPPMVSQ